MSKVAPIIISCHRAPSTIGKVDVKYSRWTKTGTYCELSGQDCKNCPMSIFSLSVGSGCFQPKANEMLKRQGKAVPKSVDDVDDAQSLPDYLVCEVCEREFKPGRKISVIQCKSCISKRAKETAKANGTFKKMPQICIPSRKRG